MAMTTDAAARVAAHYLERLDAAAREARLPEIRRQQLIESIGEHLDEEASLAIGGATNAVLDAIDQLGDPAELVAAAQATLPDRERVDVRHPIGALEAVALVAMCFGWFFFAFGTAIALAALVASRVWNVRDKAIGAVAAIAPLVVMWVGVSAGSSPSGAGPAYQGLHVSQILVPAGVIIGLLAPFFAAAYLWRQAHEAS